MAARWASRAGATSTRCAAWHGRRILVVLAHELAHELLHHGDGPRATRDTRELEAEAVAFVVSTASGLETLAATVDYVHLYRGDRQALAASLDRVQRTAATILRPLDSD